MNLELCNPKIFGQSDFCLWKIKKKSGKIFLDLRGIISAVMQVISGVWIG